ncbi:MAG: methionine biosynthesis protein MetW [Dehalococcoidia bacterium]|nr:methionine biosynthesis protein MetW [Dehalococcoidia bacterium]
MACLRSVSRRSERASKGAILDVIEPRAHGRLLDCGCGDGEFTAQVACRARVSEAYGIECAKDCLKEAADRGIIVTEGDLNDPLPYKSRFFNIVHADQIIEHLPNIALFLKEIKRVLRPDGYAVLSINNLASWHNRFCLALGGEAVPSHVANDTVVDNAADPLQAMRHPSEADSRLLAFSFQGLTELCHYQGFWVERLTFSGYYPLLPHLMGDLEDVHAASLIAKLRPRP